MKRSPSTLSVLLRSFPSLLSSSPPLLLLLFVLLRSMLFRFREAQAVELGVSRGKGDRRPRLASTCTTLKDCERWRGEILREISRKVSKIQDGECPRFLLLYSSAFCAARETSLRAAIRPRMANEQARRADLLLPFISSWSDGLRDPRS